MIKPITPKEVVSHKVEQVLPEQVLKAFNDLIAQSYCDGESIVYQDEVVARLNADGYANDEISKKHMLDVEDVYREAGWNVEYDKPAYNESGRAKYSFRRK